MTCQTSTTPKTDVKPVPEVTIVVVPRERFSYAEKSLESIYQHTTLPFKLVYVDGNSPRSVRRYLQKKAAAEAFTLLRTDVYLYPNQARNLGLQAVDTPYVVFVDNDVIVSPGWLEALVDCAKETDACVVGPLMCQYEPIHRQVHFAGGEAHIWEDKLGRRRIREKMYSQGKSVSALRDSLTRIPTELAEFHCVLVRTSIFEQIGTLDEGMLNTKEHLDFCMTVRQAGETVYFEPSSLVTYVPGRPKNWGDAHYYMLRWSDAWTLASLHHFRQKWNLAEDGYFKTKYKQLGWRRHMTVVEPVTRRLTLGQGSAFLVAVLTKLDTQVNRYLTNRHQRQQSKLAPAVERLTGFSPVPTPELKTP